MWMDRGDVVEMCIRKEGEGGRERIVEILDEDGRRECWMKKLQVRRREKEGRREGETEDGRTKDQCERERERKNEREREEE